MIVNNFENEMTKCLEKLSNICIYENGYETKLTKSSEMFNIILNNLEELFQTARVMPAYGVSLDNIVKEELKNGRWLELSFETEQMVNGLPFSKLLFKLEECYGFNLIRQYQNSYDGRCIFLDLNDLTDLENLLN